MSHLGRSGGGGGLSSLELMHILSLSLFILLTFKFKNNTHLWSTRFTVVTPLAALYI